MQKDRFALQREQAPSPQGCFPLHHRGAYNAGLSVLTLPASGARMTQDQLKQAVAQAAVDFILPKLDDKSIVGVGTGATANCFIDALAQHKGAFDGAVASSEATAARLKGH